MQIIYTLVDANSIENARIPAHFLEQVQRGGCAMLQLLWSAARAAGAAFRRVAEACEEGSWRSDPLSHPAIRAMSERERADLPAGQLRPPLRR
jgi:hypothetical protein